MIILGIDPGLRTTGFGVIQKHGSKLRYIASGTIKSGEGDLPTRSKSFSTAWAKSRAPISPTCGHRASVRQRQSPIDAAAGQARGAAICALVSADLSVAEYSPTQIKQAVVGTGRAVKAQVQDMVARLLSLPGMPGTDAADALGVAICHAHSRETLTLIQSGSQARGTASQARWPACACGAAGWWANSL
jgi:crossover junction endodeoxyribonuclease RuvC